MASSVISQIWKWRLFIYLFIYKALIICPFPMTREGIYDGLRVLKPSFLAQFILRRTKLEVENLHHISSGEQWLLSSGIGWRNWLMSSHEGIQSYHSFAKEEIFICQKPAGWSKDELGEIWSSLQGLFWKGVPGTAHRCFACMAQAALAMTVEGFWIICATLFS
jgi:hypothetical protein